MPSLYMLIPVAIIFCGAAVWALFWALNNDQYKDIEKEASRILFDETVEEIKENKMDSESKNINGSCLMENNDCDAR